ncbi:MAG: hypothetical protein R3277_11730 [Brumimicrobium sp.]|nr:hypothetical protein [Brumimicrobium sp.]
MKKYIIYPAVLVFLVSLAFTAGSCRKKGETTAIVTVRDTANVLVPGATVILYGESTTDPIKPVVRRDTAITNSSGVAVFNYDEVYQLGQAGVVVLNIYAEKNDLSGEGIIKVEEETENSATVFIQP